MRIYLPGQDFPILNTRHNVKHLVHDIKKGGITDQKVYELAIKEKRIIVTFNKKHFDKIASQSKETGVFAVSTNVSDEQIDKKISALLSRKTEKNLYGKFHYITLP